MKALSSFALFQLSFQARWLQRTSSRKFQIRPQWNNYNCATLVEITRSRPLGPRPTAPVYNRNYFRERKRARERQTRGEGGRGTLTRIPRHAKSCMTISRGSGVHGPAGAPRVESVIRAARGHVARKVFNSHPRVQSSGVVGAYALSTPSSLYIHLHCSAPPRWIGTIPRISPPSLSLSPSLAPSLSRRDTRRPRRRRKPPRVRKDGQERKSERELRRSHYDDVMQIGRGRTTRR